MARIAGQEPDQGHRDLWQQFGGSAGTTVVPRDRKTVLATVRESFRVQRRRRRRRHTRAHAHARAHAQVGSSLGKQVAVDEAGGEADEHRCSTRHVDLELGQLRPRLEQRLL